jgi:hypothetical protein
MGLSVDCQPFPGALRDFDFGDAHLLVTGQEMFGQDQAEAFDLRGQMLARENVDRVLDRVGRDDLCVVAGGVGGFKIALQPRGDFQVLEGVDRTIP